MNKLLSRINQYLGFILLSLSIYPAISFGSQDIEQATDITIVGAWQSEPTLGQLGLIQSIYTFNADGTYSNKLDFISFCEKGMGQNCEYFWMVFDGRYSVENGVITLSSKETKYVTLKKGESKPNIRVQTENLKPKEYMVELDEENLIMTDVNKSETFKYKPFVTPGRGGNTPSFSTQDIEQATDITIVGTWQSEPYVRHSSYIQSSYTFYADGSFSSKVDFIRLCKDVPEQNCKYYWVILDGRYSIKNGKMTLYINEVKTVFLRKGQNEPEIRGQKSFTNSDEYMAGIDAGNLIMTNTKSNESVMFKPINND